MKHSMTVRLAVTAGLWAAGTASADSPVATPPPPATPADNQIDHAKRDIDKSTNDAGRSANQQAQNAAKDAKMANDSTADDVRPTAPAPGGFDVAVRKVLADVTAAAVVPDHLDRLTQRLAQPDRDRIRTGPAYAGGTAGPALDDAAGGFDGLWQRKYGHPFTAAGAAAAMNDAFVIIKQGEPAEEENNATTPVDKSDLTSVAVATVAASHGLPEARVPLVREMPDGWKLDVPDTVDADAVRKNLVDEIGAAAAMKDRWPADEAEGYRAVIHRVMLAVMGQPLPAQ